MQTDIDIFLAITSWDALLCGAHTLQSTLEMGLEARIVQIDFSASFDRVNHQGVLFKLWSVEVGGFALSVLTQFLSNQSQMSWWMVVRATADRLMWCQECFGCCFSSTPWSFSL